MKKNQRIILWKVIKKIGILPYTQSEYWLCSDDKVRLIGISILSASLCEDSLNDFMQNLNRYKIELV